MAVKPIELQTVRYRLMGGVDSKVSGYVLPAPKLQLCENAYSDLTGSLQRRWGRSKYSEFLLDQVTPHDPFVALGRYEDRLIGMSSGKLYDYGSEVPAWSDQGRLTSWPVSAKDINAVNETPSAAFVGVRDMALIGDYRCYVYDTYKASGANTITTTAFTLADDKGTEYANGQVLATVTGAVSKCSSVRVVAWSNRFFIVFYDVSTAKTIKTFVIDTTSAASLASTLAGVAFTTTSNHLPNGGNYGVFDLVTNPFRGPFLAFTHDATKRIDFGFLNFTGTLTNSSSLVSGVLDALVIAVDAAADNNMHAIAYLHGTNPADVYVALRNFTGAWAATATSAALDSALATPRQLGLAVKFDSNTVVRVFYEDFNVTLVGIRQATFTTGGTPSPRVRLLARSQMISRPFVAPDGRTYFWVTNELLGSKVQTQPTMILMNIDGTYEGFAQYASYAASSVFHPYSIGHVPVVGSKFSVFVSYFVAALFASTAMREIVVDTASPDSHVTLEDGGTLLIPGAVLRQYDGVGVTENQFLFYQNVQNITAPAPFVGTGGLTSLAGTTYGYRIVKEWTNARGERDQSTDNGPVTTRAFTAGENSVNILIKCEPWTMRKSPRADFVFAIYRTEANPTAESPHYRVGTIPNNPALDTVTFLDEQPDSSIRTEEQLRWDTEIEPISPPPGHILCAGLGRVFIAGAPDDPNRVMYTKKREHGQPLHFSDVLSIIVPTNYGPIMSLAVLADSLVIFCARATYRVSGEGTNNAGTSGGFSDPILVSSDQGAQNHRGTVLTPAGVLYDSSSRGYTMVTTQFQANYIGAPLEKLDPPGPPTGAQVVPALQQVRISYANVTHVFDYFHGQWYVFTHGSEGPTVVYNDFHTAIYLGLAYHDDPTSYNDDPVGVGGFYAMKLLLGWQPGPASLTGDISVRKIALWGESLGAHYLLLSYAKDGRGFYYNTLDAGGAGDRLHFEHRVPKRVGNMILIQIADGDLGGIAPLNTAGMRLNELTFELAVRGPRLGRKGT